MGTSVSNSTFKTSCSNSSKSMSQGTRVARTPRGQGPFANVTKIREPAECFVLITTPASGGPDSEKLDQRRLDYLSARAGVEVACQLRLRNTECQAQRTRGRDVGLGGRDVTAGGRVAGRGVDVGRLVGAAGRGRDPADHTRGDVLADHHRDR